MGKVGSTSIDNTLFKSNINCIHAHWMRGKFPQSEFPTNKPELVRKIKSKDTDPLKVIVPIREPLSRALSAFTFNLIKYGVSGRQESVNDIYNLFLKEYDIHYPDRWFETELMCTFDFNPFESKFDYKKGYKIYKVNKHRILIIRLEDCNRSFTKAIHKLLGIKNVEMIHINKLETKKYIGDKYAQLKLRKFSNSFLDKIYNLNYVKHFYTKREINNFRKGWSNGI